MIKITHPITAQTATVTKGAYAQVYAPIGWVLAEAPVRVQVPEPVREPQHVKETAPKKASSKAKKTKAQVIDELLAEEE